MPLDRLNPGCNCCEDTECVDCSAPPNFLDVAVSGTLTDSSCDECETISNTWTLPFSPTVAPPNQDCRWAVATCHCNTLGKVEVVVDFLVQYRMNVTLQFGGDSALYRALLGGSKPTCNFSSQSASYVSGGGTACTGWGSLTVSVSAGSSPATMQKPCGHCNFDDTPNTLMATIKGTPVDDTCTDCDELEDTAVTLTRDQGANNCCSFQGTYVGSDCTYVYDLIISDTFYRLTVSESAVEVGRWEITGLNDPFDCKATRSLSFVSDFNRCDFSSTTADISV